MPSHSIAESFGDSLATWHARGYSGAGNVEPLLDSLIGRPAIVAGNGKGVFEEVAEARRILGESVVTYGVNDVACYLPQVDHVVSLHTPKLEHWVALRNDNTSRPNGNRDFQIHDGGIHGKTDWHQWKNLVPTMALSGNFAMQIAYLMGCAPIVLCGCPGDNTPRFWELVCENPGYKNTQAQIIAEMGYKPEFKKVVRSMSGWSKEFF